MVLSPVQIETAGSREAKTRFRSRILRALVFGLCLLPMQSWAAFGVELPRPDEATHFLAPERFADAHPRWTTAHRREAALLGDFLLWPAITIGPVLDTNPFQQHRPGRSALGLEFAPVLLAEREGGLHRTDLYAAGSARIFPDEKGANTVSGWAGVLHDWAIRRDLTIRLQGEIARRTDPFNNTQLVSASAGRGLIEETSLIAASSVQKTFDRLFVSLSGTALRSTLDTSIRLRAAAGSGGLSDETVLTLKGRVGYLLPASAYVFAEPAGNWRALDRIARPATGTRTVAGLGIARLGLLRGEVFAGWQEQSYPRRRSSLSSGVFGGRLSWEPTRIWALMAQYDETLGDVAIGTAVDPVGTPIRSRTALIGIRYAKSQLWTAQAEAGSVWIDYVGTPRSDRLAFAGLRAGYALSRSLDLTGHVRVSALDSTVSAVAYRKVAATLAATYHY